MSTLDQKIKMSVTGLPITLEASPMSIHVNLINVEHDENDEDLWGFQPETNMIELQPPNNYFTNPVIRGHDEKTRPFLKNVST